MRSRSALLLLAVLGLAGCSRNNEPVTPTSAMNERVQVGHIIYTVFDTQWLTRIGDGVDARVPQNRYFLVRLSAVNTSNAKLVVPSATIVDDDGKTYPELSNANAAPQWIGLLREARPAEAVQGNIVFDAPPRHYKLRVTDEDEQQAALIDIPLSLGSDIPSPPVPAPEGR